MKGNVKVERGGSSPSSGFLSAMLEEKASKAGQMFVRLDGSHVDGPLALPEMIV